MMMMMMGDANDDENRSESRDGEWDAAARLSDPSTSCSRRASDGQRVTKDCCQ